MPGGEFTFKQFSLRNGSAGMALTTDAVLLGAWAFRGLKVACPFVWDAGCGTAILALMLAQRFPDARIRATDISPEAVHTARANVAASPFRARIQCLREDVALTAQALQPQSVDLLIANPPYYTTGPLGLQNAPRDLARSAQVGFEATHLFAPAHRLLSPGGRMALVTPAERLRHLRLAAAQALLSLYRCCSVSPVQGHAPAVILTEWGQAAPPGAAPRYTHLNVREAGGEYSTRFRALTQEFYL